MDEVLHERLEQVINLIPQFSWSLMDEEQKDELMAGIVLPRYMAVTSDGTKLTPTVWGSILGASAGSIRLRVQRLKASQKSSGQPSTNSLTANEQGGLRSAKSTLTRKPEAVQALVESLPLETRIEVAKALAESTKSPPVSGRRQQTSRAANAPLNRAVNSFAAQVGTVNLIERATAEINDAVAGDGLDADALQQIEGAVGRLVAAVEFAKTMGGVR
jgi:hypothetical protein